MSTKKQLISYAKSDIDNILLSQSKESLVFSKSDEKFINTYEKFNNDFNIFLTKLPNHAAKKYVSELQSRDMIYLGINQLSKSEAFFSKLVLDDNYSLRGIILDVKELEIKATSGDTKNIDDCIYATYFSFIRTAVIANRSLIKNDRKLQELLAQYLFLLIISSLDAKITMSTTKQKYFTKIICYYAFYRYFIKETKASTVKILKKIFSDNEELFKEFEPKFKDIEKYESVKDIPKMLIDSKISVLDPNIFIVNLLRKYKQYGFYCILGPLDMFVAFIITCKYPFELFTDAGSLNSDLQNRIEDHMIQYMKKVKFGIKL